MKKVRLFAHQKDEITSLRERVLEPEPVECGDENVASFLVFLQLCLEEFPLRRLL